MIEKIIKLRRVIMKTLTREDKENNKKVAAAQIAGTIAFNEGKKRIPAHDSSVMKLLEGYKPGNKVIKRILNAWIKAWDLANLYSNT
jgi:hypothetical protein